MYINVNFTNVLIIALLLPWRLVAVQYMSRYFIQPNKFVNHGFKNITSSSEVHCTVTCESYSGCSSVSYHGNDRICQLNSNHISSTTVSGWTTFGVKCPNNWMQIGRNCYLLVTVGKSWSDAEVNCNLINGHLADINTVTENQVLAAATAETNQMHGFWIGLHDPASNDHLVYSSGTTVTYQNYETRGYYNVKGKRTDCFSLVKGGIWNDIMCSSRRKSICKLNFY